MTAVQFLIPAFLACLILTGIHTYLGLHVVRRGIIFLDIALAQIAALGMSLAMLLHYEPDSTQAYLFALAATMVAAILFSLIRHEKKFLEPIIGITFAVSSALSILVADRLPHGGEHLKEILNGNILWVTHAELIKTGLIYSIIGILHFLLRHQLAEVSENRRAQHFWLDLFFYGSFGLVITSSVQIAGVLLVFSFLIVPAVMSQLFFSVWKQQVLFGWFVGLSVSVLGLFISYRYDLPTGAALVSLFGVTTLLSFVIKRLV